MSLVGEALKYLQGRPVIIVTTLHDDGVLQELAGILVDANGDCLVIQQGDSGSPTLVNTANVAWLYEETEVQEGG